MSTSDFKSLASTIPPRPLDVDTSTETALASTEVLQPSPRVLQNPRVLVCGGRNFRDHGLIFDTLTALLAENGIACIIEGGALGADEWAALWADMTGIKRIKFPADWNAFGRRAGPIRNQQMIDHGKPDLVIAFPGGRGTADMVARARKAGIEVREIAPPPPGARPGFRAGAARP